MLYGGRIKLTLVFFSFFVVAPTFIVCSQYFKHSHQHHQHHQHPESRILSEQKNVNKESSSLILPRYCDGYQHTSDPVLNKRSLIKYIDRGNTLSSHMLYYLKQTIIGDRLEKLLFSAKGIREVRAKFLHFFGQPLIIFYILLAVVCVVWIVAILVCFLFGVFQSMDASKAAPSINDISKGESRCLFGCSIAFLTLLILFAIAAAGVAVKLAFSSRSHRCQTARISNEFYEGILYEQHSDEASWLSGLPTGDSYLGLPYVEERIETLKQSFFSPAESGKTIFQHLDDATSYMLTNTTWVLEKAGAVVSKTLDFDETKVVSHPASWILYFTTESSQGVANSLLTFVDNLVSVVSSIRNSIEEIRKDATDSFNKFEKEIFPDVKSAAKSLRNFFRATSKSQWLNSLWGSAFVIAIFLSLLSLIGIIFVVVMMVKLRKHHEIGVEPPSNKYRRWFAVCWSWFAFSGLMFFAIGGFCLSLIAYLEGGCEILRTAAVNPAYLDNFSITNGDNATLEDTILRTSFESCFAPGGDGDIYKDINWVKRVAKILFEIKNLTELVDQTKLLQPLLQSLNVFNSTVMVNSAALEMFGPPNLIFVPPAILFSGTQEEDLKIPKDDVISNELYKSFKATVERIRTRYFPNWNDQKYNPSNDDENTVYSLIAHLNAIEDLGEALGCKDVQFCATLTSKICSSAGGLNERREIDVSEIEFKRPPSWDSTGFHFNFAGSAAAVPQSLSSGSCDLSYNVSSDNPDDKAFTLNSFVVGLFLAREKIDLGKTAQEFKHIEQAIEILWEIHNDFANFASDTNTKADLANERLNMVMQHRKGINCKAAAYSIGAEADGFCKGVQQDLLWIFLSFFVMGLASIFFWVVCYKLCLYFKRAQFAEQNLASNGSSMIFQLLRSGKSKEVEKHLEEDRAARLHDKNYNSGLHAAAFSGSKSTVEVFVDHCDPDKLNMLMDQPNRYGYTPLGIAAAVGHVEVVDYLMELGAKPVTFDEFGESPLHTAARAGRRTVVEVLCKPSAKSPEADRAPVSEKPPVKDDMSPHIIHGRKA